ncbi:hypothetical protein L218DRAFT_944054 [Marasmius fiardii PR-910]|nr:hypothetical protein L218DRAFT_944054 [Marasmius fiardii PR-910]
MPLPAPSKPGEPTRIALQARQSQLDKQAIVVRLNPEALNALGSFSAQPQVDIDLIGDSPGFYIGNSFFPFRFQREEISHEIYLRSATANKLNAPLRCHANVVGKLSLTDRELDPHTEARIRNATSTAREQKDVPKTKYIDPPQDLHQPPKRKKEPMFRKPVKPSDQPRVPVSSNTSTGSSHPRPSHQPSSSQSSAEIVALKKQIIHYLAVNESEKSLDDVLRTVGPEECDIVTRRRITDALGEVAEQRDPKSRMWSLKPNSWLEVRPWEWPKLSDTEKVFMARKARMTLKGLGIPESDPAWDHVKPRPNNPAATPNATSSAQSTNGQAAMVPKRGISSKEAKQKKAKAVKVDAKDVPFKDEGRPVKESKTAASSTPASLPPTPPTASSSIPNKRPAPVASAASELPARPSPVARKPPGSGFKLPKANDSSGRSDSLSQEGSPAPPGPPVRVKADTGRNPERASVSSNVRSDRRDDIGVPPPKRVKRLKEEAGFESERDYDVGKDRSRERDRERDQERDRRRDSGRERDYYRERERERERGRERGLELDRGAERERGKGGEKERIREKDKNQRVPPTQTATKEPYKSGDISGALKRKKPPIREEGEEDEDDDSWSTGRSSSKKQRISNDERRPPPAVSNGGDRVQKSVDRPQKPVKNPRDMPTSSAPSRKQFLDSTPPPVMKERIKKESSPLAQLPKIKKDPSPMPLVPKAPSTLKSSSKTKRRSPVYTSSEDEDESAVAPTKQNAQSSSSRNHTVMPTPPLSTPTSSSFPAATPRSVASSSTSTLGVTLPATRNGRSPSPLPTDHAGLRARYRTTYMEYLETFRTAMTQKSKIENLLQNYGEGSVASFTDSDGEELLDYERLAQVVGDTKRVWDELQGIQQAYEMSARS